MGSFPETYNDQVYNLLMEYYQYIVHLVLAFQTCCRTPVYCQENWVAQNPPCTSIPGGCSAVGNQLRQHDA